MIWGGRVDPVREVLDPNWAEYEGYVSGVGYANTATGDGRNLIIPASGRQDDSIRRSPTVGKQSDPLTSSSGSEDQRLGSHRKAEVANGNRTLPDSPWQRDYGPRYAKPVPPSVFWGLAGVGLFILLAQFYFYGGK